MKARLAVVVMGVSGAGKSSVGVGIAAALGVSFVDGDALHSPESVAKMQAGTPLDDADRWPWLDRIGARLADTEAAPDGLVIACSALKRTYRDRIRAAAPGVRFVFLDGSAGVIAGRLQSRSGHYMPASLLESQLQALQRPDASEPDVLRFDLATPIADLVAQAAARLRHGAR